MLLLLIDEPLLLGLERFLLFEVPLLLGLERFLLFEVPLGLSFATQVVTNKQRNDPLSTRAWCGLDTKEEKGHFWRP